MPEPKVKNETSEAQAQATTAEEQPKILDVTPAIVQQPATAPPPTLEIAKPAQFKTYHFMQVEGSDELYQFGEYTQESTFQKISALYPPIESVYEDKNALVRVFKIPAEAAKNAWKKTTKNALLCAYNSTKEFMQNNLGCKLDGDDEAWYKNHPWTTSSGLPAEHTIDVLNELVRPYGLGVSNVYVRKGFITYDEHKHWYEILGVNPMAVGDKMHSNEEYIEAVVSSVPDEIKDMMRAQLVEECKGYKFEYVNTLPERALVTCAGGYDEKNPSTAGGGHATYRGPRSRGFRWEIAVAFDRIENCVRHQAPPAIPESGDGVYILEWMDVLCPEDSEFKGKKLREVVWSYTSSHHHGGYQGGYQGRGKSWEEEQLEREKNQRGLFGKGRPPKRPKRSSSKLGTGIGDDREFDRGSLAGEVASKWFEGMDEVVGRSRGHQYKHAVDELSPKEARAMAELSDQVIGRSAWQLPDYEWKGNCDVEELKLLAEVVSDIFFANNGEKIAEMHATDKPPMYWSDTFGAMSVFSKDIRELEQHVLEQSRGYYRALTLRDLRIMQSLLLEQGVDEHFVIWYLRKIA